MKIHIKNMNKTALKTYSLLQELHLMFDDSDRHTLRTFELTNRQYHALQHLPQGTSRHLTEMSELLFCDKSNVTGLVDRMVRDGLITRDRSERDRRYLELKATEQGNDLRQTSRVAHEAAVSEHFSCFKEEELVQLDRLLTKLANHLRHQLTSVTGK